MRKKLLHSLCFLFLCSFAFGQNPITLSNAEVIPLNFSQITAPVSSITTRHDGNDVRMPRIGYHPKNDWPLHEITNKAGLPQGLDPAWQRDYPPSTSRNVLLNNFEGQGPDGNFNPGDPALDVGPNHVVQMVNGIGGSNVEVLDKSGNSITTFILDGVTNIGGAGDPIVIYDQLADRWLLSEFAAVGNTLVVAISTTPDPAGSYAVYSFNTPDFPDYPKYSIWNDSYIVTTNEANPRIYALDRTRMLNADPTATAQQFDIAPFGTIDFQAATPVNLDGTTLPPANAPGMFMRMADDGWTGVTQDRLEIFEMDIDFNNPANSSITGPIFLPTQPFDTELNGFNAFAAIPQPGTALELDPLREVLMNKIIYRNFGSHESLVCNHVTDVTGNDDAGVRWYELRRTGGTSGAWTIYQQGTYAPDNTSRWMAAIGMNDDGSIGLAYNVSDATSVFPGIRYTGRIECDPLGMMTFPETTIIEGSASNISNRYGDYNTLSVDPSNGTFWVTAQYNQTPTWATRIANFEVPFDCFGVGLTSGDTDITVCQPDDVVFQFDLEFLGGFNGNVTFSAMGLPAGTTANFSSNPVNLPGTFTMTVSNTGAAAPGIYSIMINATDGTEADNLVVNLTIDDAIVTGPTLMTPADNSINVTTTPAFAWAAIAGASSYTIEIATDPNFNTIVETATTTTLSYTTMTLNSQTQYYWRVFAENSCGPGPVSTVFMFETGTESCILVTSADTPIDISPDGTPTITSEIIITQTGAVSDLNILGLDVSHTWVSDLTISITSPSGTTAALLSTECGSDDDIMADFDDLGGPITCPPTSGGPFAPEDPFSGFNGEPITGTWTLTISDASNFDGGSLNSWSLELCGIILEVNDCPAAIMVNDISGAFCDGVAATVMATDNANVTYTWSSSNPNVALVDPAAASTSVELSALTPCQIESADISLVAVCNSDGTELFNGVVSSVMVYPAPPADITTLVVVNSETCDDPVMVDPNCAAFITLTPDPGNPAFPVEAGESGSASYTINYAAPAGAPDCCPVLPPNEEIIIGGPNATQNTDGDLEVAGPANGTMDWTSTSTNFGTVFCQLAVCGDGAGSVNYGIAPNNGAWLAWFGGAGGALEVGTLETTVVISECAAGSAELTFGFENSSCGSAADFIELQVDGTVLWSDDADLATCGVMGVPLLITVDVSAFADGASHTILFTSTTGSDGNFSNFTVDNIILTTSACSDGGMNICEASITSDYNCEEMMMPPPIEEIPTMGEWGLMILGLLILIVSIVAIREQKQVLENA